MNCNNQQVITNYFQMNQQQQENNNVSKPSSFVGNTQLNRKYRNNSTVRRDHRQSPEILFNFIQYITENEDFHDDKIKHNPWIDICPFKCDRDNLDYCLWRSKHLIFCNPPFSGGNNRKWLNELVKFVEKKQGNAVLLHKIDGMCASYWFDLVYDNKTIIGKRFILRNNFCFSGYHTNKQNKGAPFGTALVLLQPNKGNVTNNFVSYPQDLEAWKDSMSNDEYDALQERQRQHKEMYEAFFQCKKTVINNKKKEEQEVDIEMIGNNDNKQYESEKQIKDNTITQMLRKEDDGESTCDDNISLDDIYTSTQESRMKKLQNIFGNDIYSFLKEKDEFNDHDELCMDIDINVNQTGSGQCSQYECYANNQQND